MIAALLLGLADMASPPGNPPPAAEAQSEIVDIGFAPPTGEVLHYRFDQGFRLGGRLHAITYIQEFLFEPAGDDWLLWIKLVSVDIDPAEEEAALMEAAAAPMVGLRYAVRLSSDGEIRSIPNQPEVWQRVLEGFTVIRQDSLRRDSESTARDRMRRELINGMAALDEAGQREQLLLLTRDVIAMAGGSFALGRHGHEARLPMPWGGTLPLTGSSNAQYLPSGEIAAQFSLAGRSNGETPLHIEENSSYRIRPDTGLVTHMRRERRTGAAEDPGAAVQIETMTARLISTVPPFGPGAPVTDPRTAID